MTLIACTTPQDKQGYALGIYSSSLFSGDMTGLFLGGFMAATFGYRNSFDLSAILVLGTALLILFGTREDFHRAAPAPTAPSGEPRCSLRFPHCSSTPSHVWHTAWTSRRSPSMSNSSTAETPSQAVNS